MKLIWLFSWLLLLGSGCATTRPQPLTPADIIALTQAGVADEEIIQRITASRTVFRLSAADVVQLRQAGVSERIVDNLYQFSIIISR